MFFCVFLLGMGEIPKSSRQRQSVGGQIKNVASRTLSPVPVRETGVLVDVHL